MVPESAPTATSIHSPAPPIAPTANAAMTSTIAASQAAIVRRIPTRSASTPPASTSTASGMPSIVSTRLAASAPKPAAAQPIAKKVTESPKTDAVDAASQGRNPWPVIAPTAQSSASWRTGMTSAVNPGW